MSLFTAEELAAVQAEEQQKRAGSIFSADELAAVQAEERERQRAIRAAERQRLQAEAQAAQQAQQQEAAAITADQEVRQRWAMTGGDPLRLANIRAGDPGWQQPAPEQRDYYLRSALIQRARAGDAAAAGELDMAGVIWRVPAMPTYQNELGALGHVGLRAIGTGLEHIEAAARIPQQAALGFVSGGTFGATGAGENYAIANDPQDGATSELFNPQSNPEWIARGAGYLGGSLASGNLVYQFGKQVAPRLFAPLAGAPLGEKLVRGAEQGIAMSVPFEPAAAANSMIAGENPLKGPAENLAMGAGGGAVFEAGLAPAARFAWRNRGAIPGAIGRGLRAMSDAGGGAEPGIAGFRAAEAPMGGGAVPEVPGGRYGWSPAAAPEGTMARGPKDRFAKKIADRWLETDAGGEPIRNRRGYPIVIAEEKLAKDWSLAGGIEEPAVPAGKAPLTEPTELIEGRGRPAEGTGNIKATEPTRVTGDVIDGSAPDSGATITLKMKASKAEVQRFYPGKIVEEIKPGEFRITPQPSRPTRRIPEAQSERIPEVVEQPQPVEQRPRTEPTEPTENSKFPIRNSQLPPTAPRIERPAKDWQDARLSDLANGVAIRDQGGTISKPALLRRLEERAGMVEDEIAAAALADGGSIDEPRVIAGWRVWPEQTPDGTRIARVSPPGNWERVSPEVTEAFDRAAGPAPDGGRAGDSRQLTVEGTEGLVTPKPLQSGEGGQTQRIPDVTPTGEPTPEVVSGSPVTQGPTRSVTPHAGDRGQVTGDSKTSGIDARSSRVAERPMGGLKRPEASATGLDPAQAKVTRQGNWWRVYGPDGQVAGEGRTRAAAVSAAEQANVASMEAKLAEMGASPEEIARLRNNRAALARTIEELPAKAPGDPPGIEPRAQVDPLPEPGTVAPPRKPIATSQVQEAWPTARVTQAGPNTWTVEHDELGTLVVQGRDTLEARTALGLAGHERTDARGLVVRGKYQPGPFEVKLPDGRRVTARALVSYAKEGPLPADLGTLRHESRHDVWGLLPKEVRARLFKRFSQTGPWGRPTRSLRVIQERFANDYAAWEPEQVPDTLFGQVRYHVRNLLEKLWPTWRSDYQAMRQGADYAAAAESRSLAQGAQSTQRGARLSIEEEPVDPRRVRDPRRVAPLIRVGRNATTSGDKYAAYFDQDTRTAYVGLAGKTGPKVGPHEVGHAVEAWLPKRITNLFEDELEDVFGETLSKPWGGAPKEEEEIFADLFSKAYRNLDSERFPKTTQALKDWIEQHRIRYTLADEPRRVPERLSIEPATDAPPPGGWSDEGAAFDDATPARKPGTANAYTREQAAQGQDHISWLTRVGDGLRRLAYDEHPDYTARAATGNLHISRNESLRELNARSEVRLREMFKGWSDEQLEDAIYYRQRTANPRVEGDTPEAVAERLGPTARKVVDEQFQAYMDETFARITAMGDGPEYRKHYLTQFYEGSPEKIDKALAVIERMHELMGKGAPKDPAAAARLAKPAEMGGPVTAPIRLRDPFKQRRAYATYEEAAREAGLKPKFRSIKDIAHEQQRIINEIEVNRDLLKRMKRVTTSDGQPIILPSDKAPGWWKDVHHPVFQAERESVVDGVRVIESVPAKMHPSAWWAIRHLVEVPLGSQGNWRSLVWRNLEAFNSIMKSIKLSFSLFHHEAILESGLFSGQSTLTGWTNKIDRRRTFEPGRRGLIGAIRRGKAAVEDPELYVELRRAGVLDAVEDAQRPRIKKLLDKWAEGELPATLAKKNPKLYRAIKTALKPVQGTGRGVRAAWDWNDNLLWEVIQKNLKAEYYLRMKAHMLADPRVAKFKFSQRQIERQAAASANAMFGGQNWADNLDITPNTRKFAQMLLLAPDWTYSNVLAATDSFARRGPRVLRRPAAIRSWLRTVATMALGYQVANQIFAGQNTYENDPGHELDIEMSHRDSKGRKVYIRPFKQVREVARWLYAPAEELGNKLSPVIQAAYNQAPMDRRFPTDWQRAEREGNAPLSPTTLGARAKTLAKEAVPFSLSNPTNPIKPEGGAAWMFATPTVTGMTDYKTREQLREALREGNETLGVGPSGLMDRGFSAMRGEGFNPSRRQRIERILTAAKANNINGEAMLKQAMGDLRSQYYVHLAQAIQKGDTKRVAELRDYLTKTLEANPARMWATVRYRMTDTELLKDRARLKKALGFEPPIQLLRTPRVRNPRDVDAILDAHGFEE